jgi:ribulose-5-phosphate 4-epimerase/fuculose-1-phosphate aldolase
VLNKNVNSNDKDHAVPVSKIADRGDPSPPPGPDLVQDLVLANRILFKHGVVDAFGHVSVRHPHSRDRFLLARNRAPALVDEEDIVEFHLDGTPVDAAGRPVYLERFIHGEIYRKHPDIKAVVHSHAPAVIPFGISRDTRLRPVWGLSGFLGTEVPVFEIRDVAGEATDLLISSNTLGGALANAMGQHPVILMRGHGATVVAPTLREVVFRAVYTQVNAHMQYQAIQLGAVTYLTEAEAFASMVTNRGQIDRAWHLWVSEIGLPGT